MRLISKTNPTSPGLATSLLWTASRITQAADNFKRCSDVVQPGVMEIPHKEYDALLEARKGRWCGQVGGYCEAMLQLKVADQPTALKLYS